ncbi:hypothetical protein [Actinoplanes teichomyceticus]|uniref:Guanylate cyclase domain-containing protein n=1 Tax=Actinoplanes teichomyceticus TaxID=1867 RepID=A0A561WB49_ACTTI|nr:hypothetical protein [Actinoplanes teichomyceticus]TWG21097.1 hypothetical protein FHX34_103627 [Actinoplanes teichomyceticus]GIF14916.1 hypothetical protein Ate01nite_49480 [Actinoplanes teichomyceticus]
MPEFSDPKRRVVVSVDMESYSRRSNALQYRAQQDFRRIMDEASAELGVHRPAWLQQQAGDGELAILPPDASERALVGNLTPTLDRLLRQYNMGRSEEGRIRLRVAVHQGLVHLDGANGFPGDAVVTACRLIDSPVLKDALKRRFPRANVALMVSDQMYTDVVCHYQDLRPDLFQKVQAELQDKGFSQPAWLYVPHENAAEEDAAQPAPVTPSPRPAAAEPPGTQVFRDIQAYGPTVFGNHNTQHNGEHR